ncbi:hypothetical protein CICLE_v10024453mg [Citrus x clementina]|uniref:Uncharacterized protein n=1 Tax=Citrus clementina TaxID=85681 RepID=V4VSB7_CITCL|nr:hypothetical protein CICLE_v10024453mg [Citrus x clementina]
MIITISAEIFNPHLIFLPEKEAKKEAFRKYLDSSGVLDALTKDVLYQLSFGMAWDSKKWLYSNTSL